MFPPDPSSAAIKEAKAIRAMKAAAFAADPTGYVLEEMSKNSTILVMPILGSIIERTGQAPVRKDNTDASNPNAQTADARRTLTGRSDMWWSQSPAPGCDDDFFLKLGASVKTVDSPEGYVNDPSEQPMLCLQVAGKMVVKVYRSGKITYPVYDALGPNPKTVTHDGHWSASGSAILELCQQNADLCTELAAAKQALDDIRKLLVIPSHLDATEATTRILNTIKEDRNTIAALHKEVREAKQALTEKDSTIAALRAVLPAKVSITVSGNATISAKAERPAYQQPAPSDIANDRDDALRDTLRSLGMGGSFARNVALTALSVGPVDVEDHRVTNAVRAREEEILTYLRKQYKAYSKFAEPPKTWFRRFFGPHEWEIRGDSFCRALLHVHRFIRKDSLDSVLDNMRFNP